MFKSIILCLVGGERYHFHSQQIRNKTKRKFKEHRSWPGVQRCPLHHVLSLPPSPDLPHQTLTVSIGKHVEKKRITRKPLNKPLLSVYLYKISLRLSRRWDTTDTNLSLLGSGWWARGLSRLSIVRSLLPVILGPGCAVVWLASCSGRCTPCCSWGCSWCCRDRATCLSCRWHTKG